VSITDDILLANNGRRLESIAVLAHGLMMGDKATLKLGYSRGAALSFAIEAMSNLTDDQRHTLDRMLDIRLTLEPVEYGPGVKDF
jgi:hypothetical protein